MTYIGICTRERPKMLAALLESIALSVAQAGGQATIILVENGPETGAKALVDRFADRLTIIYKNEPRLGLVYARNAVIEAFLATDGQEIILLDDDSIVPKQWFRTMTAARAAYPEVDAVFGPVVYTYEKDAPRVIQKTSLPKEAHGRIARLMSTNNCMLSRGVFANGENIHLFDLTYNLSGGEDFDFFARFHDRGLIARFFSEAMVYEHVLQSRQTVRFQFAKWRHQGHCHGVVLINRAGLSRGRLWICWLAIRDTMRALIFGAIGSLVLVMSEKRGLSWYRLALRCAALATGRPRALFKRLGETYKSVQGE